jgi:hypothetical protein
MRENKKEPEVILITTNSEAEVSLSDTRSEGEKGTRRREMSCKLTTRKNDLKTQRKQTFSSSEKRFTMRNVFERI